MNYNGSRNCFKPNCCLSSKKWEVFSFNFFPSRNLIRSTTARFHITIYLTKLKKVPGFELLSLGIEYYKNEKVIPWYEYTFTEHELVNHDEMLKNIFMDKGMPGIQAYVQLDVPIYLHNHSRQFPDLYRKPNTTN